MASCAVLDKLELSFKLAASVFAADGRDVREAGYESEAGLGSINFMWWVVPPDVKTSGCRKAKRTKGAIIVFVSILASLLSSCSVLEDHPDVQSSEQKRDLFIGTSSCALPCLFGITAGKMNYFDALAIVNSDFPEPQVIYSGSSFWVNNTDNERIDITLHHSLPKTFDYVDHIELRSSDNDGLYSLGDVIDTWGEPVTVFRNRIAGPNSVNLLLVFRENQDIFVEASVQETCNRSTPVRSISLVAEQDSESLLVDLRSRWHYDDEIDWLGFVSVENYWEAASIGNE
jgi:hypothetical protein